MDHTLSALIGGLTGPRTIGAPGRPWLDGPGLTRLAASVAATLAGAASARGPGGASCCRTGRRWPTAFLTRGRRLLRRPAQPRLQGRRVRVLPVGPEARGDHPGGPAARRQRPRIAGRLGIPILTLTAQATPPACSGWMGLARRRRTPVRPPAPEDPALVLHTSGTTARPKIVPLTNANLVASARHIAHALALHAGRHLPQRHAAVPHPRADRRGHRLALRRCRGVLHAGVQRVQVRRTPR